MGASHGVSVSDPDYKFTTTRTKDGNIPWFIYKKSPKVTGDASSTTGSSGESGGEDGSTSIGDYSGEAVSTGEIDYVGKYVQKFESGDRGSSMISSGKGDSGGVSFGLFQFPSYGKSDTGANSLLGQMWANYKDKYPATVFLFSSFYIFPELIYIFFFGISYCFWNLIIRSFSK